ncbi:MAG: AMP-binding protein [Actinobacteria bacterium]|nr:AMP-binding protein [Actinomycetota bacterium]
MSPAAARSAPDLGSPDLVPGTEDAWRAHWGEDLDAATVRDRLVRGSLPAEFAMTAGTVGDSRPIEIAGVGCGHAELDEKAARTAAWLARQGVRQGDRIILCGATGPNLVQAYLGTLRLGAVAVPLDVASTQEDLDAILVASGARAAFADPEPLGLLASSRDRDRLQLLVGLAEGIGGGPPLDEALANAAAPLPAIGSDAVAMLAYTSGTTGAPKGVPLTHGNLLASIRAALRAWHWSVDDVLVHALPLSHQHGLSGLHASLLTGSGAILLPRFDSDAVGDAVARGGTVLFGVPAMYERLRAVRGSTAAALRGLRLATSGSAPLSSDLANELAERVLGQIPLERYGSTETGLSVSNVYGDPRPGEVGLPLPGLELAIVGPELEPVPAGEEGEILLRGPQVVAGYLDDPEATAAATVPGGWFRTGDLGRLDDSGRLTISGRLKELIITGGLNVAPREVEAALTEQQVVAAAAVAGMPSERWGEMVVAAVVPAAGVDLTEAEVLALARERLAPHKRPKRVVIVEALPVNRLGKVVRSSVPALFDAQHSLDNKNRRN